jgi:F-type H+-transporting ATPase subunit a
MSDPLAPQALFGHVEDSSDFHLPEILAPAGSHGHVKIPQPFDLEKPIYEANTGSALIDRTILPFDLKVTKFMVLEVAVAVTVLVLFVALAKSLRGGATARGRLWNMLEVFLLFIRDEVARPCIGRHDADRFVPFLWTLFLFVLGCNLTGMIPWMGAPTGALATTGALAFITFLVVIGSGMKQLGVVGFWKAQVPHMDLPGAIAPVMKVFIFVIELFGLFVKHAVLAVRLLANMMAGHVVLAVFIAFIGASTTAGLAVWGGISFASVLGATALSMLELFVAFLQAYIFTFLSALFIGAAVHPH